MRNKRERKGEDVAEGGKEKSESERKREKGRDEEQRSAE